MAIADQPSEPVLKPGDLKLANQALWKLEQALHIIDQADRAGIDTTSVRQIRDDIFDQVSRIKAVYFPGAQ